MEFLAPGGKQVNCCTLSLRPEHLAPQQNTCGEQGCSFYVAYRDGDLGRYTIPNSNSTSRKSRPVGASSASKNDQDDEQEVEGKRNAAEPTARRHMLPAPTQMSIVAPAFPSESIESSATAVLVRTDPLLLCTVPTSGFTLVRLDTLETMATFSLENAASGVQVDGGPESPNSKSSIPSAVMMTDTCWLNPTTAVVAEASGKVHIVRNLLLLPTVGEPEDNDRVTEVKKEKTVPEPEATTSTLSVYFSPVIRLIPESATEVWVVGSAQMALLNTVTEMVSEFQGLDLPEPIAAVASVRPPPASHGCQPPAAPFWCASEHFISLIAPVRGKKRQRQLEQSKGAPQNEEEHYTDEEFLEAAVLGSAESEDPLSAAFATQGGHVYVVTNSGSIVEVLSTPAVDEVKVAADAGSVDRKADTPGVLADEEGKENDPPTPAETTSPTVRPEGTLTILRASNLLQRDGTFTGKSDPFVKITIDGVDIHRTKTVDNKLNPVWAEGSEVITIRNTASVITLEVWEDDCVSGHDFLGSVLLDLKDFATTGSEELEFKLEKRLNEEDDVVNQASDLGALTVSLHFPEVHQQVNAEAETPGSKPSAIPEQTTDAEHSEKENKTAAPEPVSETEGQTFTLRFGDDFGIEALDQDDASLQPFRVDLLSNYDPRSSTMEEESLFFVLTATAAITVAANREPTAGAAASTEEQAAPAETQQPHQEAFDHHGARLVIAGDMWDQVQRCCGVAQTFANGPSTLEGGVSPLPRKARTVGLDTEDLEVLSHHMDEIIQVRLIGEGSNGPGAGTVTPGMGPESEDEGADGSGSGASGIRFLSVPHGCSLSVLRDKLETLFDRRLVISFPSVTSVTSSGQRKLIELRSTTLKIFHAISSADDKSLICRSLYPQVSRARSTTPGVGANGSVGRSRRVLASREGGGDPSDLSSGGLSGSALLDQSGQQRSRTPLTKAEHSAMVGRLYTDTQRERAIKRLQLEEKFLPRATPIKLEGKTQQEMVLRLAEAGHQRRVQHREQAVKQFEKDGQLRPKDARPTIEEEQALVEKFYYEARKKEQAREQNLEKKLFQNNSQKSPSKLRKEDWAAWQEKRGKSTGTNRLKDQFY